MKMIRSAENTILITDIYKERRESLVRFVVNRIHDTAAAEDVAQDVFIRLLELQDMICKATVEGLIFAIARNLIIDYVRKKHLDRGISTYMFDSTSHQRDLGVEEKLHLRYILNAERKKVDALPERRKKVYCLYRYKERSVTEIAERMNLSVRTVEKHLYFSRRDVRAYLRKVDEVI